MMHLHHINYYIMNFLYVFMYEHMSTLCFTLISLVLLNYSTWFFPSWSILLKYRSKHITKV